MFDYSEQFWIIFNNSIYPFILSLYIINNYILILKRKKILVYLIYVSIPGIIIFLGVSFVGHEGTYRTRHCNLVQ